MLYLSDFWPLVKKNTTAYVGYLVPLQNVLESFAMIGVLPTNSEKNDLKRGDESDVLDILEDLAAKADVPAPEVVHCIHPDKMNFFKGLNKVQTAGLYVHWNYLAVAESSKLKMMLIEKDSLPNQCTYECDYGYKFSTGDELIVWCIIFIGILLAAFLSIVEF